MPRVKPRMLHVAEEVAEPDDGEQQRRHRRGQQVPEIPNMPLLAGPDPSAATRISAGARCARTAGAVRGGRGWRGGRGRRGRRGGRGGRGRPARPARTPQIRAAAPRTRRARAPSTPCACGRPRRRAPPRDRREVGVAPLRHHLGPRHVAAVVQDVDQAELAAVARPLHDVEVVRRGRGSAAGPPACCSWARTRAAIPWGVPSQAPGRKL